MPKFQDDEGRREALYAALPALVILDPGLKPGTVRLYAYLRLRKGQNSKATTTVLCATCHQKRHEIEP